jgi:predicted RNA-binding Zn-ribbon protein involved in translation (DUF1610 family)
VNQKYDCPSCGGAVVFQSSIAVFAVCPYCRTMVVRHDVNVEAIGQLAALPPDLSPLQIGTTGEFENRSFTLIGRVRLTYTEGSWTEWYVMFGDNSHGWLGEAQGFFSIGSETPSAGNCFPTRSLAMPVGTRVEINGLSYVVTDRKATTCLWGEGELPFIAKPGREAISLDLTGPEGRFASGEFVEKETRVLVGRFARFDDLKFSNLRPVPGWSEEAIEPTRDQTTALNCPKCGSTVQLRAAGFSMSATCGSCGSLLDTATPDLSLIRAASQKQHIQPLIPIGRRGELFGVIYEVIGFQHVNDGHLGWFEYLLFNPWQGFVWLVTYQGHWTFVNRLFERPEVSEPGPRATAKFKGETYRFFDQANVRTDYVLGEFYWKVAVGMPVRVSDYINPPKILSCESYETLAEETWSQGEYIEPEIIHQAFKLELPLRERVGIYLNQPNPHLEKGRQLKWLAPLMIVLLVLIQIVSAGRTAERKIFENSYVFSVPLNPPDAANGLNTTNTFASPTNSLTVTEPFEVPGHPQALNVILSAPVNNSWVEFTVNLVNAATQQTAARFVQEVGYYHGNDGYGVWTEGSQRAEVFLPSVNPGKYFLTIDVAADPNVKSTPYTVSVVRDVTIWSNFWLALPLLLAAPVYRLFRAQAFEKARWEESDVSFDRES